MGLLNNATTFSPTDDVHKWLIVLWDWYFCEINPRGLCVFMASNVQKTNCFRLGKVQRRNGESQMEIRRIKRMAHRKVEGQRMESKRDR